MCLMSNEFCTFRLDLCCSELFSPIVMRASCDFSFHTSLKVPLCTTVLVLLFYSRNMYEWDASIIKIMMFQKLILLF